MATLTSSPAVRGSATESRHLLGWTLALAFGLAAPWFIYPPS